MKDQNQYEYENEMRLRRAVENLEDNIGTIWANRPNSCSGIKITITLYPEDLPRTKIEYESITK